MTHINGSEGRRDPFRLERFISAQQAVYGTALTELTKGRKRTHWMWYIFPQFEGLGYSATSKHYAIRSLEEAQAYLDHPVLGARLQQCAEAVLAVEERTASEIFGSPDDVKLQSSMTLFAQADGSGSVFTRVLEKYFDGQTDGETLRRLGAK
ncbi:MAG: DUF1810 domain-containing protein [Capsulimonas sp.]|uniref:DUF1810 domain-containing protein n=1 Tax=Capsulimonas sp. TaxID=2494211 RepID=UPI003266DA8F